MKTSKMLREMFGEAASTMDPHDQQLLDRLKKFFDDLIFNAAQAGAHKEMLEATAKDFIAALRVRLDPQDGAI